MVAKDALTTSNSNCKHQISKALELFAQPSHELSQIVRYYPRCVINPNLRQPFEYLVRSIISQQLSSKAASTIVGRVEVKLGRKKFSPKNILALSFDELRACGLSTAKVNYAHGIAQATLDKTIIFEDLYQTNTEQAIEQLVALKGVGEWTAQMFCIFALGHLDVMATADVGLQRGLQILHQLDEKPNKQQMLELTDSWRPYRSVGSWYLWRLADDN
ncbi:MAG: DNA-3-methyladenine glycosylase 2 family protein [Kangiellaceae bacterium]|nr:DNA-3-methyladenine glycosylase 2 family protein [Kangiellaceae bacterium]